MYLNCKEHNLEAGFTNVVLQIWSQPLCIAGSLETVLEFRSAKRKWKKTTMKNSDLLGCHLLAPSNLHDFKKRANSNTTIQHCHGT